jgi:hypothetical protein
MRSVTSKRLPVVAESVVDLDLAWASTRRRGARELGHLTPRSSGFRPRTARVHVLTSRKAARALIPKGHGSRIEEALDSRAGPDAPCEGSEQSRPAMKDAVP